ncbi:hypothetical protein SKAU_G00134580 [Synaphobranchus kaupii]|uniref:Uncharacterized protein n=1 Tax=Synaphobranchus kaupii TaxID=118154 RepID=A0A9Q1FR69_SYNKA|nr:hypothetical protein SKAU_G00134580 [Synaphobranchus kaupii]
MFSFQAPETADTLHAKHASTAPAKPLSQGNALRLSPVIAGQPNPFTREQGGDASHSSGRTITASVSLCGGRRCCLALASSPVVAVPNLPSRAGLNRPSVAFTRNSNPAVIRWLSIHLPDPWQPSRSLPVTSRHQRLLSPFNPLSQSPHQLLSLSVTAQNMSISFKQ